MIQEKQKIESILKRYPKDPASIIQVLQDINDEYRYLPCDVVGFAAEQLGVPKSRAFSVATFYKAFSLKPRGEVIIKICKGTACHIRGAEQLSDELQRLLKIEAGETTKDMKFTIEEVNCVGACAMAPVIVINEKYHGSVTTSEVKEMVELSSPHKRGSGA
ncbi:MAG: NADH-quinone oxidoreductase subunit NuoE [Deltaproteobacteria bacterium CG11_big_fil_rev_8_21_14_0_20_49_13]|nr:MAG: NADH-quinone oxidoreductase subunit NuoE [Deltaproteobacteria bacterium CG11_big_fil_rev_8_21_14_0_20_49_13]